MLNAKHPQGFLEYVTFSETNTFELISASDSFDANMFGHLLSHDNTVGISGHWCLNVLGSISWPLHFYDRNKKSLLK